MIRKLGLGVIVMITLVLPTIIGISATPILLQQEAAMLSGSVTS